MESRLRVVPTGIKDLRLPVFVSRPLKLTAAQSKSLQIVARSLSRLRLEARTYATDEFPDTDAVTGVRALARICCGGVILGFRKYDVPRTDRETGQLPPTPWNHLEAGILISLHLPLWILRERDVSGGIFDPGSTDSFIHQMPRPGMSRQDLEGFHQTALQWAARVRAYYYRS